MKLTEQEQRTFKSLSQSGEGEVVAGFLDRLADSIAKDIIDNNTSTLEDVAGARLSRKIVLDLKEQLLPRGNIKTQQTHFE